MNASWVCRPYADGDERGICELYRQLFQFDMTTELWRWFFQASPDGLAVIVVLEKDGRVVGHYAVQPRKFWFGKRLCTAGLAVGTMVCPEIRSVTALTEMAQQAYRMCRNSEYGWLYAFPNDQAHRIRCRLLGWRTLPEIVEWDGSLPLLPELLGQDQSDVHVWNDLPESLAFDGLLMATDARTIRSARTTAWIRWRFFERPGREYVMHTLDDGQQVFGYAVTKRYQRDGIRYGHIVDWQLLPGAEPRGALLLASVWRQLHNWDVERVSAWAQGDDPLCGLLSAAGFSHAGRKSNFCYYDLDGSHEELLADGAAWHCTMADSDVF